MSSYANSNYLKKFDLGWVFYDDANRGKRGNGWEDIRKQGVEDAKFNLEGLRRDFSGQALRDQMSTYSKAIENMAKEERDRELALLSAATEQEVSMEDEYKYIRHFNEIVLGQERFAGILKRVTLAIKKGGKERAPSQAAHFVSRFTSAFNECLKEENDVLDLCSNDRRWKDFLVKVTNIAVFRMLDGFEDLEDKQHFGLRKDYEGLSKYLMDNPVFYDFVRSYLKIDKLKEEVEKIVTKQKKKRYKDIKVNDVYKAIDKFDRKTGKLVDNEIFARMIAGSVEEFLDTGMMQEGLRAIGFKTAGNSLKSNIGATDTITLVTRSFRIPLEELEAKFQEAAQGFSQEEIAENFAEASKKLESKDFSDLFIIHGSSKLYTMGESFKRFEKTDTRIQDFETILNQSGIQDYLGGGRANRLGNKLISLYHNTIPGAALSEEADEVKEIIRVLMAAVAGRLLFSDWSMIGYDYKHGAKQIHVFNLEGIIIPLSFVLKKLAYAMEQFGNGSWKHYYRDSPITVANFKKPSKILYPRDLSNQPQIDAGERYPGLDIDEETGKSTNFYYYWEKQRSDAVSKSKVQIRFMHDFKKIIMEEIENEFKNLDYF